MNCISTSISILIFTVISAQYICAQTSRSEKWTPIKVVIAAPVAHVKLGSDIKLHVEIANVSSEPISLSGDPDTFNLEIHDSRGQLVGWLKKKPNPNVAKDQAEGVSGSYQGRILGPQQSERFDEILNKKFDLTKPGAYTIQASKLYKDNPPPVRSNIVRIVLVSVGACRK